MDNTSEHAHEPTVDDLRVKLCYICREEERYDGPSHPPTVWKHPCKCTLVAHESCLLHWIKTQQREFGRSRGDLKCPQCGELYEFEGFNPRVLRILNTVNRTITSSGRFVTACSVGTIIVSAGAGIYLTCTSYGAFALREFIGPDIFHALLTDDRSNWPLHAFFYLPTIPFSLIVSRTSLILWATSPLVPLLFPWPSTIPISASARGSKRTLLFGPPTSRLTLWPPPPALVCALFPVVRILYHRLRERIIRMIVGDIAPTRARVERQRQQQRRVQQEIQEQQLRRNQPDRLEQFRIQLLPRRQQPQPQQQRQQQIPAGPDGERRVHFQVGGLFGFEIAHYIFDRGNPPAPMGDPVRPAVAVVDDVANGGGGRAEDNNPADRQQQPHRDEPGQEPEGGFPAPAPADQDGPQQQQEPAPPEPQQQQQQQRAEPEPGQGQHQPVQPARDEDEDEDDLGAAAARASGVRGVSLGRLVGGALLMPSIARIMGSMLLQISHVVPLIRTIIAPLPPALPPPLPLPPLSGPIRTLLSLIRGARVDTMQVGVGYHRDGRGWASGSSLGAMLLRGLFATSQEWSTSDPVWWRNTLGLGIFLVVKDGLKLYHLWLAKRELEERHIKNKSFAGIDMAELDLVERNMPEA